MNLTLLVIDDSATARALLKACLPKNIDIKVHEADNYDDALAQADKHNPDVCILDYNMPEKTGIDIAKALQSKGTKCQFILMTANTQQSVLDQAKELGFVAVLEKPISPDVVKKTLEEMM